MHLSKKDQTYEVEESVILVGSAKNEIVRLCREAIKKNQKHKIIDIVKKGREDWIYEKSSLFWAARNPKRGGIW